MLEAEGLDLLVTSDHDILRLEAIYIKGDLIYRHTVMRINYTTYDVRRAQDTLNLNTDHRDIMLLSPHEHIGGKPFSTSHQYQYARVVGIYHANVICTIQNRHYVRRMEFLWVRYLEVLENVPVQNGWSAARLDRLTFRSMRLDGAFGFVDPEQVIRACHLIPRFCNGKAQPTSICGPSARPLSAFARDHEDWKEYYVNRSIIFIASSQRKRINAVHGFRFVDRDMMMRFHWGLGVGHLYTCSSSESNQTVSALSETSDSQQADGSDLSDGDECEASVTLLTHPCPQDINSDAEDPENDPDGSESEWDRDDDDLWSSDSGGRSDMDSLHDGDDEWEFGSTHGIEVTSYD
jgi:hypothetical protein